MAEFSMPWDGTTLGDAVFAPYTSEEWTVNEYNKYYADPATQGVIAGSLSAGDLQVTNPSGTTIRVLSGSAMVDGTIYATDSQIDFAGVVPGAGSNFYTVVLRKSWAAQTVRAALLGPSGVGFPTPTRVNLTTWELSLGFVQITSGGVVTVTDARRFINPGGLPAIARAGGSSTDWFTFGTTIYRTGYNCPIAQCGSANAAAADPGVTVTFPIPFAYQPLVFCQPMDAAAKTFVVVRTVTATGFTATKYDDGGFLDDGVVMWYALGPLQG